MTTTLKITAENISESLKIRCNLSDVASGVEVDYCNDEGQNWYPTQWQAGHARHSIDGLTDLGAEILAEALEMPVADLGEITVANLSPSTGRFSTAADVAEWMESVDESTTQRQDIEDELADAWLIVYGNSLADEDDDMQRDAWSHLCSAVL